jgi:GMP synthase-like glutamine amidotransferase
VRRGLVLQNDDLDPPALLADWLDERGIPFEATKVWEDGLPRDPSDYAWIAALGSRHSVTYDEPGWIATEVDFLRRSVSGEVPVLGICFGGQALAAALGGEVSSTDPSAVGWIETRTSEPELVSVGPWLHLNSDQFAVPKGATLVASVDNGPSAFRLGPHLGLQFHPEATPQLADRWADHFAAWIGRLGSSPERIREEARVHASEAPRRAFTLFDAWWARATGPA